jgi:FlaA1/EpsC-like NDP-sugar epimerase
VTPAKPRRAWRSTLHHLGQVGVDAVLVAAAWWLAFLVRFDGDPPGRYERLFLATVLIVVGLKLVIFVAFRFYSKWWRFTSVRDLQAIVVACAVSSLVVTAVFSLWQLPDLESVPRGVLILDFLLTLTLVGGARFLVRSVVERPARGELVARGKEVLICGAGDAGNTILREMKRNAAVGSTPIGLIDDDPRKRRLRVNGVKVLGGRDDLRAILRETGADEVIIAMPSAPGLVRREIVEHCRAAGVPVKTLPGLPELISGEVTMSQLREVQVEDVLGRAPVEVDFARVARYLNGRTVMVTGAGGSIGRELCRQVAAVGPRRLVLLDHAENNLFEVDLELRERGHAPVPVIADCKDPGAMGRALAEHRPEIVFHAAAYKHVPMMELNPMQAIANNALATELLAELAVRHGVERLCLISTDKAVEPKTVMGATKALAERIVEWHGKEGGTRFAAVRFGNVLGSSGSVLPIFRRQIAQGGPVTVTHPDMTRYFMTIPEAVQLVIEATGIAEGGDIFVLDMGEPVRILDLAHNMIRLSGQEPGRDVEIEVTGIRPGEKLHEELFNLDEEVTPTRYGKVMRATRPPLDPSALADRLQDLREQVLAGDRDGAQAALWAALRAGREATPEGEPDTATATDAGEPRP